MIYLFIGTIAELIKVFPLIQRMSEENIGFQILASNQNNLYNSDLIPFIKNFQPIQVSDPPKSPNILGLFSWFLKSVFKSISNMKKIVKKNDILIVHGDTLSSLLGALSGRILGMKVIHLEAGLRSFNLLRPFPEEICRRLTSLLSDVALCPNEWAMNNLKNKKLTKINTFQNTLYESCKFALKTTPNQEIIQKLPPKPYFIFITHRQENIYNKKLIKRLIDIAIKTSEKMNCVFILHSSTKAVLERLNLLEKLKQSKNIYIFERIPYITFTHIINNSEFIITDGGSNQEETFYLGKPCLILRRETERIEGLGKNVVLSKLDFTIIENFINNYKKYESPPLEEKIYPSKIIVEFLKTFNNS